MGFSDNGLAAERAQCVEDDGDVDCLLEHVAGDPWEHAGRSEQHARGGQAHTGDHAQQGTARLAERGVRLRRPEPDFEHARDRECDRLREPAVAGRQGGFEHDDPGVDRDRGAESADPGGL